MRNRMNALLLFCMVLGAHGSVVDYDYYVLSQIWPVGYCKNVSNSNNVGNCNFPTNDHDSSWTIHGLWPTKNGTEGPNDCDGPKFDIRNITDLIPRMNNTWVSYSNWTNEQFWEHEWNKHGTCAWNGTKQSIDENQYFNTTLSLIELYQMTIILKDARIVPRSTNYRMQTFAEYLEHIIGKRPEISCSDTEDTSYIQEIMLCFDLKFNLVDCPGPNKACSHEEISYDYFHHNDSSITAYSIFTLVVALLLVIHL